MVLDLGQPADVSDSNATAAVLLYPEPDDDVLPTDADGSEGAAEEPLALFDEPVYIQRYVHADEAIRQFNSAHADEHQIRVVADVGCAELRYASRFRFSRLVTQVLCVDVDEALLCSSQDRVEPQLFELISPRELPLQFCLYAGSACQYDKRLFAVDAVTMIEFIEHVDICDHESIITTVFDLMQPNLVFITTPNVEFNVVFPDGSVNKRRHYDHRFEWTRAEFQLWCTAITARFSEYSVIFTGIGAGPPGTSQYGCCSQAATFTRNVNIPRRAVPPAVRDDMPYKLVSTIDMPFRPPKTAFERCREACRNAIESIAGDRYREGEYIRTGEVDEVISKFVMKVKDDGEALSTPVPLPDVHASSFFQGYTVIRLSEICNWLCPKRDIVDGDEDAWGSCEFKDSAEVARALADLSGTISSYWTYDAETESFTVKYPCESSEIEDDCENYESESDELYKQPVLIEEIKDNWDDAEDEGVSLINKIHSFD